MRHEGQGYSLNFSIADQPFVCVFVKNSCLVDIALGDPVLKGKAIVAMRGKSFPASGNRLVGTGLGGSLGSGERGYLQSRSADSIGEQLAPSRPDEAVALYHRVVPPIVEQTSNRAYEQAIQLIRKIVSLMKKQNQTEQFRAYLAEQHARYKLKRNFIKLLNGVTASKR